jgi:hypothetical protein
MLNAFFFGFFDEATSIDHYDIMVFFLALMNGINVVRFELSTQYFTVYQILAATQCDDVDLVFFYLLCFHCECKGSKSNVQVKNVTLKNLKIS